MKKERMPQVRGCLVALCLLAGLAVFHPGDLRAGEVRKGSLHHDGFKRTYLFYVPHSLPVGHRPAPLLLVLHGGGGKAQGMLRLTYERFDELAERDGWIVVYPDGLQKQWNDGRYEAIPGPNRERETDDVGFLVGLIDRFVREEGADPHRVYVTGISNGGLLCHRLACEWPGKIAAVAPVAASLSVGLSRACAHPLPVPMLWINGDEDPIMPYEGGEITVLWMRRGRILPVESAARQWALWNGCGTATPSVVSLPDRDPGDGTTVTRTTYGEAGSGREVILYTVHGGGHTWPQGLPYLGERVVGRVSREFNACDVIWEFFSKQHR